MFDEREKNNTISNQQSFHFFAVIENNGLNKKNEKKVTRYKRQMAILKRIFDEMLSICWERGITFPTYRIHIIMKNNMDNSYNDRKNFSMSMTHRRCVPDGYQIEKHLMTIRWP